VTVYQPGSSVLAVVYSDHSLTTSKANPFVTNADGTYDFFAPPGEFKIQIVKPGFLDFEQDFIQVGTLMDHGQLSGLGDDDHPQYGLLAGRSGGQTFIGGTGSGQGLSLSSTSHATKGLITLGGSSAYSEVTTRLGIGTTNPLTTVHSAAGSRSPSSEVGGVLVAGASTSERFGLGYETGVGAWCQSTLNGTGSTSFRINPLGGNVGIGLAAAPGAKVVIVGTEANNAAGAGTAAALRLVNADTGGVGRLAELQFGCAAGSLYAAISGYLSNASNNTQGDLVFSTRNVATDAALTQRARLDSSGRLTIGSLAGNTGLLNVWSTLDGVTSGLEVRNTNTGHAIQVFQDNTNGKGVIQTPGFTHLSLKVMAVERLMIDYNGNYYLSTTSIGASSGGVLSLGNASAIPTGNATNAYMIYAQAGALKGRGTSGTITTIGAADPHCPSCGRDFALEWESERYGYLAVCVWCLTEGLDKGVISRRESRCR